jgi:anaerobic magnesium-protoporphyrin IX monomethyl ester cyclase
MKCLIILVRYYREGLYNPETESGDFNYNIPVGLAYISAFLKQNGHTVEFLNLNHLSGRVEDLISNRLQNEKYDFMITGGISPFYPDISHVVKCVRKWSPGTRIILGGGLISSQPEIMFGLLQPDYGVIGEGELTVKELFECLENNRDVSEVNGLIFRNADGQMVVTKPRDPISDLNILPWPDYEALGFAEYLDHMMPGDLYSYSIFDKPRAYPIIASRSCPYSCTFCFHPLGKKYRKRSIDNIMEELEYAVKKYNINLIIFYDELFANDRSRTYELCGRITEFLKTVPWEVKWFCQMRVDILDDELITTMKNAGCYYIGLGLESYSAPVLKSMNKHITPKQIDDAFRLCKRHQMAFTGNFIFGDPAETTETYHETIKYWKENNAIIGNQVILGLITLYQGSPLYKRSLEKGIIKDEVAFVEDRAKTGIHPINLTDSMTDEEYLLMIQEITEANIVCPWYSVPLETKNIDGIPEVHVKCPHCNGISVYRNIAVPSLLGFQSADRRLLELVCRNCSARIRLITKHENFTIMIYRLFGYKNGVIVIQYVLSPPLKLLRTFNKLIHKIIH